ncbi:MAG: type IV secretion system DNA-binding domain-containing protein, partial [Methylococcales bacterium]|nr:type IV secretion system DNA-binding domain-containing protein [Methylococcales bacterium]
CDITTKGDARDIAAMLIKESQDPMWSDAARQIFTGVVTYLIATKGQDWGFRDLTNIISLEASELEKTIRDYAPESRRVLNSLKDSDSNTGQSIMITMDSFMAMLFDMADAWPDFKLARLQGRAFSIRQWLEEDYQGAKVLIVQGSERYKEMRKAFGGAFFTRLIAIISDASFPEAKQRERDYRLYFFFDEFPQMGKVESIERLISVCRSKGVRALLGFQDINQVYETYSKETADAWFSQLSTKIICNLAPGNTAKWIAETFDKKEFERANQSGSMSEQENGGSVSLSWEQKEMSVLYPSQISTDLGASPKGVIALLACSKWQNIYRLHWPITKLAKRRPAVIPADWTEVLSAQQTA